MEIRVGTRIRILPYAGYNDQFVQEIGTVERGTYYGDTKGKSIGVRLDNFANNRSSYGIFWFRQDRVQIIEIKNEEENEIMLKNYRVAEISFLEGSNTDKLYAYALYDEKVSVGDTVVVQSGHHGLGIAKVVVIHDNAISEKCVQCGREIIAAVDFTAFNERKAKAERMKQLKASMDKKVEELQNQAIYELLAEKDASLKEMLDEFKALQQ